MSENFETLLLHVLVLIFPIFIYQLFWHERPVRSSAPPPLLIGTLCSCGVIVCMLLPYEIDFGYTYDLRIIPLLISYLYGGPLAGLLSTFIYICMSFITGGEGFWFVLQVILPVLLIGYLYTGTFQKLNHSIRITTGVVLSLVHTFVFVIVYWLYHPELLTLKHVQLFSGIAGIQATSTALVFFLIEKMLRNESLRMKLWQSEKSKVVQQLAASVSHEVRNPLTATTGFLQLLKQQELPAAKRELYIQVALDELKKAESIVSDYLSLSHSDTTVNDTLNLKAEAEACMTMLGPYAKLHNVQTVAQMSENIFICGNQPKLRQCLINMMRNGIEAMPSGGQLLINLTSNNNQQQAVFSITDTGTGMTEEQIKHLGSPFYAHAGKGTGLGLMVAYSIIDTMQGSVDIVSTVGEGTTFSITLPISKEHPNSPISSTRNRIKYAVSRKLHRIMAMNRTPDRR